MFHSFSVKVSRKCTEYHCDCSLLPFRIDQGRGAAPSNAALQEAAAGRGGRGGGGRKKGGRGGGAGATKGPQKKGTQVRLRVEVVVFYLSTTSTS
jgi:hypothetical protein